MQIAQRDLFLPSGKLFFNYPIEMETSNCKYSKQAKKYTLGKSQIVSNCATFYIGFASNNRSFSIKKENLLERFFIDADKPEIEVHEEDNGIDNSIFNVQINNFFF